MNAFNIITGTLLAIGLAAALVAPDAEPAPEVQPISKAEYAALVGPLLDDLAALCGAEFDAKKFRFGQLPDGRVFCERRAAP